MEVAASWGELSTTARASSASPLTVTQVWPSRRPTTTSGTTNTDVDAAGSKAMEAKTTGPEPGTPSGSSVRVRAQRSAHQAAASARARGPVTSSRSASPQPTRPSPRRTQARAPSAGSRVSSGVRRGPNGVVVTAATSVVSAAMVTAPG
jgi:hypothetical protein